MRIRILRNILVEMERPRLNEVYDKYLKKWDELLVESIDTYGKICDITAYNGDVYEEVPLDAFEVIKS
jgi:hypothetical protein